MVKILLSHFSAGHGVWAAAEQEILGRDKVLCRIFLIYNLSIVNILLLHIILLFCLHNGSSRIVH